MHARAEYAGRSTTIYLQPGLTGSQRAAAMRRLRQEARIGCGPPLPCARLALACAADWIRCGAWQLIAIVRLHPIGTLLPVLLLSAMAGLFLHASVPGLPATEDHGSVPSTATCPSAPAAATRMAVSSADDASSADAAQCDSTPALPPLVSGTPLPP
jgi:hypothetical protein